MTVPFIEIVCTWKSLIFIELLCFQITSTFCLQYIYWYIYCNNIQKSYISYIVLIVYCSYENLDLLYYCICFCQFFIVISVKDINKNFRTTYKLCFLIYFERMLIFTRVGFLNEIKFFLLFLAFPITTAAKILTSFYYFPHLL